MGDVVSLGARDNMSVDEALALVGREKFKDILIIGHDQNGGILIRSSGLTNRDTLWLIEQAKRHVFGDDL